MFFDGEFNMLVTFQSAEFHCSFLRRHGLQQHQEPTLQGKGTPFRTEPPVRGCLQAPGCSSLRVCSCHAVNFNRQRYSTCKAWFSMLLNGTNFIFRRMAKCSSTPRIFKASKVLRQSYSGNLRQGAGVTQGLPAPSAGRTSNFDKHLDPVDLMCHQSHLPCWGVKSASRSSGFALGVKLFISRRNWRCADEGRGISVRDWVTAPQRGDFRGRLCYWSWNYCGCTRLALQLILIKRFQFY